MLKWTTQVTNSFHTSMWFGEKGMPNSKSLQSAFEDSPGTGNGTASLAFGTDTQDYYILRK